MDSRIMARTGFNGLEAAKDEAERECPDFCVLEAPHVETSLPRTNLRKRGNVGKVAMSIILADSANETQEDGTLKKVTSGSPRRVWLKYIRRALSMQALRHMLARVVESTRGSKLTSRL